MKCKHLDIVNISEVLAHFHSFLLFLLSDWLFFFKSYNPHKNKQNQTARLWWHYNTRVLFESDFKRKNDLSEDEFSEGVDY